MDEHIQERRAQEPALPLSDVELALDYLVFGEEMREVAKIEEVAELAQELGLDYGDWAPTGPDPDLRAPGEVAADLLNAIKEAKMDDEVKLRDLLDLDVDGAVALAADDDEDAWERD